MSIFSTYIVRLDSKTFHEPVARSESLWEVSEAVEGCASKHPDQATSRNAPTQSPNSGALLDYVPIRPEVSQCVSLNVALSARFGTASRGTKSQYVAAN
jgi:hypothetical protein